MEQEAKLRKFDCREQRNLETHMAKNVTTRSSSFGAVASSSKGSESVSTSPILDTVKIRRKGRLWTTRRAVSDSAFSPGLGNLTKSQEIQPSSFVTEKNKELDNFPSDKEFEQCKCSNSSLNADNQCKKCFTDKSIDEGVNFLNRNLANRLRDLKRLKRSKTGIVDVKDAQIADEEFVQSVRILDEACNLNSGEKGPQMPAKRLGLLPFVKVERLRLSQEKGQRKSLPIIHLSLDEDKEEDGDMFADKDSAEVVEDLEEFTPWKYNSPEPSPLSFHGFSSEEYKSSRVIAEESSQVLKFEENDSFFFGFSTADKEESESLSQKWKIKSSKSEMENLKNIRDDEKNFSDTCTSEITRITADVEKNKIPETDSTENVFFNYKLKRKRVPEILSKTEDHCKKKITNIAGLGNESSADCEKKQEIITKTEVLPLPRIKYMKEKLKNDFNANANSEWKIGFSTAAGRSIELSQTAIAKAKLLLSKEIESIDDDLMDNLEFDNGEDSQNKCGILNTDGFSTSKVNEAKSGEKTESKFLQKTEIKAEVKSEIKTEVFSEIECIEDDLFEELENVTDSENKSELIKAEVEDKRIEDQPLEHKTDTPKASRISCGFSTAAGHPIHVSKTALEKAETHLARELESIPDELFDEMDDIIVSDCKSATIKPEENNKNQKNEILDDTLNIIKDSPISSGFLTAAGIPIRVSKSALETAEALLSKEMENVENNFLEESANPTDSENKFTIETEIPERKSSSKIALKISPKNMTNTSENESKIDSGFSTAGGRELKISKKSWEKSKAVFDTIEEPCDAEIAKKNANPEFPIKNDGAINFGFSTAGGRELKVSEKSWEKSKAVFDTIEEPCDAELAKKNANPEFPMKKDGAINFGFSTAGGRELKVSEKSWEKSKAVFDTIEEPCDAEIAKNNVNPEFPMKKDGAINFGFSTAGGRELKVSEKSWEKSKAVFDTIEEPCDAELAKKNANPEFPMKKDGAINFGFSTAGGRELKVSEKSWEKSKAVFDTIEEPCDAEIAKKNVNPEFPMKKDGAINFGFSTAGGRELKVSEKSWEKSKAVFDTIEEPCDAELAKKNANPEFPMKKDGAINFGFSTAGGRELKVSEKSWEKSKAVFDTIEEPCDAEIAKKNANPEFPMKKDGAINFGFSTAGGRELKVSEKSWEKSKAVFDTIDESSIANLAKTENPDPKDHFPTTRTKTTISSSSTANNQSKNVTREAKLFDGVQPSSDLDNMESLEFDDFVDPVEESEATKKRKLEEIDEETPLRRESSQKRKRGRYVNDLQARKLFMEDSGEDNDVEIAKESSEKRLISEEVDASAAALLEDEERSNEGTKWQKKDPNSRESISPELGCELANRTRFDVSTKSSFGIFNRSELEKVKATGKKADPSYSRGASSGSCPETEETNDRAAETKKREEIQYESIPDDLTFDSQFSQDIQRSPVIDKFIADTMKIMEGRLAAALKQDETIRGKRRMKIEQSDGFLYRLRNDNKESRTSWNKLTDGIAPSPREIAGDSSARDLLLVTADSAVNYSFRCADFYGEMNVRRNIEGIKVGDGAFLVLDEKNCAGSREFERAFLASPGVDPNLVPTGWVKNHYRWIVWKLASMDRVKFGHKCLPRMLTPERVMLELKYRYDREIYRIQWPPIKRILERGEDPSARLVLCVSSIIEENDVKAPVKGAPTPNTIGSSMYKMKLTDGWYSISTSIDAAMINLIKSGKVREGTKLMIFGAKAVNLDQGCSVLEIPEAVTLRIYSNSTRRVKWNTKLDFYHSNRGPMSLSLKSVKSNGGAICKMVVAVSRVYPILYREKLPDGQFEFRNARCDEEAARAHEARYQAKMEEIYANAWSEFQIATMNKKGIGAMKNRSYTQEEVAACGKDMEEELRQKISLKMSECLPTPRDVTPVLKIRIAENDTSALVTVWSTDRDTTELFVEGSSIAIYNAFASGLRSNELQITAGRSTFVKREISRRISYPERIYTSLSDVTESGFNPVYGEFDTIGIVSSTGPAPHGMKNFETVNLACPKPGNSEESDYLSVLFWQGISAHGYAKILTVGSLVACSNLEWRKNTSKSIPRAYCTERSVFSKNPRQSHLVEAFESLSNEIKEPQAYAAACAVVIQEEIAKKSALRTPGNSGTPYRPATSNNRTPGLSPRDLAIDVNCTTPTLDSRKMSTRKRLEKLEIYGEPPKLTSIVINNSSRKVSADFRSPVTKP